MHNLILWVESSKYILLFFGSIFEGPVVMVASGFLYHLGQLNLWQMYFAILAGDFTADIMWYCIGRFGTHSFIFKHSRFLGITEETLEKIQVRFRKYNQKIIIFSKLTMGLGFGYIILMAAGIFKIPMRNYLILCFLGGLFWTAFLLTIGYFFGNIYTNITGTMKIVSMCISLVVLIFGFRFMNSYLKKQIA
ncbi:MAG: DedA family protein [Candidatus Paceibacterota bacterium]